MQVGVDVTCMHTSFGGCDPSGFGDIATFQKRPNFPFGAWTIVHGHGKNLINRNWLKKFMQVGVDVRCMHPMFGGAWLLWFRRYGYLSKMAKFSFLAMDYSPWSWRNLIDRNGSKKFMQVRVDIECMCTDFWWAWPLQFQR